MPWPRPSPPCARCTLTASLAPRAARRRAARWPGVGVALVVDAVVGRREDAVDLPERGDGLVEAEAERGEVVDRGLRHSPPRSNSEESEAAREAPLPRVVGGGWRGVWVSQSSYLTRFSRTLRPRLASSGKVNSMAVTVQAVRFTRNVSGRRRVAWSGTVATAPRDRSQWVL